MVHARPAVDAEYFELQTLGPRLDEVGLARGSPWAWIRTMQPLGVPNSEAFLRFTVNLKATTGEIWSQDQPVSTGCETFAPEWVGYHYEAVGLLRHFDWDDRRHTITGGEPPGHPPLWQVRMPGTEFLMFEAALWWQRAFRPKARGEEPALVAELRWWPGLEGAWPFFRVMSPVDKPITRQETAAAEQARRLLHGLQPKLRPGPDPGTGAKYDTREAWYAALNEKVRPKNNRLTARRETLAYWLDVSPTLLNQNKRKWGPKKLDDIRQGRF